jgi:hypothetical protein
MWSYQISIAHSVKHSNAWDVKLSQWILKISR